MDESKDDNKISMVGANKDVSPDESKDNENISTIGSKENQEEPISKLFLKRSFDAFTDVSNNTFKGSTTPWAHPGRSSHANVTSKKCLPSSDCFQKDTGLVDSMSGLKNSEFSGLVDNMSGLKNSENPGPVSNMPGLKPSEHNSDKIISKNLIECEVLNKSTAEDIVINSDKIISKNLIECEVLNKSTA